jgi:hypothetical protein
MKSNPYQHFPLCRYFIEQYISFKLQSHLVPVSVFAIRKIAHQYQQSWLFQKSYQNQVFSKSGISETKLGISENKTNSVFFFLNRAFQISASSMFDYCKNHCTVPVIRILSHGFRHTGTFTICAVFGLFLCQSVPFTVMGYVWAHNPSQFILFSESGISENILNVCCIQYGHNICFVSGTKNVTPKNRVH